MKNNTEIYIKWSNAAYTEFALNGPDFSLKALSEKTGLPRATFYYHFINREHLISELLKFHEDVIAEKFCLELEWKVNALIPDLYELLYQYKIGVCFHQQLLRNSQVFKYNELYNRINTNITTLLLPQIKQYFGFVNTNQEIISFYNTLIDAWYSRINTENLSVDSMCKMAETIMKNTLALYKHSMKLQKP